MDRANWGMIALYAAVCVVMPAGLLVRHLGQQDAARQRELCIHTMFERERDFYIQQIAACTARLESGQESREDLFKIYWARGIARMQSHQFGQSVEDFDEVIRRAPDNAMAYLNRARDYANLGKPQLAVKDLDRSLALKPDVGATHALRGSMQEALGQHDQAIADFQKAAALMPKAIEGPAGLGRVYARTGRCNLAEEQFRLAIRLAPRNPALYRSLGFCLARLKRDDEAIAAMNQAIAIAPNAVGYAARADLQWQLDHYAEAVADLGIALGKGEDPSYRNQRCWYRALWGQQLEEALNDCNRALDASPNEAAFLDSRGLVQFRLGQWREAVADYDAALKQRPDGETSLYVRGLARKRLGDAGGDADIAAAVKRGNGVAAYFEKMGIRP